MLTAYVGLDGNERLKFEAASVEEILEKCEEIVGNDPAKIWSLYYEDQEEIDPWFGDVDKVDIIDSWKEKHLKEYEEKEERERLERKKRHEEYLANKYVKLEQLDISKMEDVAKYPEYSNYDYQGNFIKFYDQGDQTISLWCNNDIEEALGEDSGILVNFTDIKFEYDNISSEVERPYYAAYLTDEIKTQVAFVKNNEFISEKEFASLCDLSEQELKNLIQLATDESSIFTSETEEARYN